VTFCAIEEETNMAFWVVLRKLRTFGGYGGDPFEIWGWKSNRE
jgi:hypothetical protein